MSAFAAACATNPANRRATLIADADHDAKAAIAAESKFDVAAIPPRSMAVVPFSIDSRDTLLAPLGFGLAELLVTDLAQSPQVRMLERLRVDAILRELKLAEAGVTDPKTAPRIGRLLGARRLLTGNIATLPGGNVRIHARLIDVVDGTVQELASADAPLARIFDAERSLALLLFERLGVTLTPAQRTAIEQRQSTQLATLLAFGRGVQADARGDVAAALAAFEEATRLDAAFVASRSTLGSVPASSSSNRSSVQRVISLSTQALNQPAAGRASEAADAPLPSSLSVGLVITIRVVP